MVSEKVFAIGAFIAIVIGLIVGYGVGTARHPSDSVEITDEQSLDDDTNYVCDSGISDEGDFSDCEEGDLILVKPGQAPIVCDIDLLRGGLLIRDHILPLFSGDGSNRNVMCIYRGKERELRPKKG